MENLIVQLITILTTPPGNLFYHLVLVFSVATLLQATLGLSASLASKTTRRLRTAALFLLLFQVIHLLTSAFAWQGMAAANLLLPPVDRSIITLSFIWILWVWIFPKPSKSADWMTVILSIAVAGLFYFSLSAWSAQSASVAFNNTLLDWSWSVFYTVLLIAGALLVMSQKSAGWGLALIFININLLGTLAHMLWASPTSDLSAALRISLLCSFPLLPGMVYYQQQRDHPSAEKPAEKVSKSEATAASWLEIPYQEKTERFYNAMSRLIAIEMDACCALWLQNVSESRFDVFGYQQDDNSTAFRTNIPRENLRAISKALGKPQPTLLEMNPLTKDEIEQVQSIFSGSEAFDRLFILPIQENGHLTGGFLMGLPSGRPFQPPPETFLRRVQQTVASYHKQQAELETLRGRSEAFERELESARYQIQRQQAEVDHLKSLQVAQEKQTVGVVAHAPAETSFVEKRKNLRQLIDEVLDQAGMQLLENNIALRFDLPNTLQDIDLAHDRYQLLSDTLIQLTQYACNYCKDYGTLQLQVKTSHHDDRQLIISLTTEIKDSLQASGKEVQWAFDSISRIFARSTGLLLKQSLEGNFLTLLVILPV